jgi:hypothetical protein
MIKRAVSTIPRCLGVSPLCLHLKDGIVLPVSVDLIPDRGAAKSATVFVFIPFRQHEKKEFIHRHCLAAFGTVKLSSLELMKT